MALSNEKPRLSRQYLYVRFADLSFDLATADVSRVALLDAGVEPQEEDWIEATVVTNGHVLYRADVGDAFALLIGPTRGDAVDTNDLEPGTYQCWTDTSTPDSDERIVEVHGTITVTA